MWKRHRIFFAAAAMAMAAVLALWIAHDLTDSTLRDLRQFDGHEVGRLETAMWRAYYEHHPVRLFVELSEMLRRQYHLPFWRSCVGAYYAARAAVVFQRGHSHADYMRALLDLDRYYALIRRASKTGFDAHRAALLELDWWIVHRERAQHRPEDLYSGLARLQSEIYRLPEERFEEHARTRGEAMLLRDARAGSGSPSETDWQRIAQLLDQSWVSLGAAVGRAADPR
ncbi:MAG TPA: hypothetical protein VLW65_01285 [Bryobacteraceae bacterium]|nr:hypothetical protein [Bryobacteraceae bacterium]